jgi:RpiR family carbohydrate utilization transcriptional regulator
MRQATPHPSTENPAGHAMPASPLGALIDAAGHRLSRAERRVAGAVQAWPDEEVAGLSIRALAVRSYTSDPTVVRFCHQIGFASFRELKQFLCRRQAGEPWVTASLADAADSLTDIVGRMTRHQAWNLLQRRPRFSGSDQTVQVMMQLPRAGELHLFGSVRVAAVVDQALAAFTAAGAKVHAHLGPGQAASALACIATDALAIVVWDARPDEWLHALVLSARQRRIRVLGVAARQDALAAECDWAIAVEPSPGADGCHPMAVLLAQSTLLDALAAGWKLLPCPAGAGGDAPERPHAPSSSSSAAPALKCSCAVRHSAASTSSRNPLYCGWNTLPPGNA